MKRRSLKKIAVMLLACLMLCSFLACGSVVQSAVGLRGIYVNREGIIEQKFIFDADNKVRMSAFGLQIEGDYVIESDMLFITYTLFGLRNEWSVPFEYAGDTIYLDGVEFVRVS